MRATDMASRSVARSAAPLASTARSGYKWGLSSGSSAMALKYGRAIEARLTPVSPKIERKPGLDLSKRPRRNRKAEWSRRLVREHELSTYDLIWPLFLVDGVNTRVPVASMPGVERLSVDEAVREAERAAALAIPCLALFPYTDPKRRDEAGSEAVNPDNLVCRAISAIKRAVPEVGILCDVALDPYTSHGHDGLLRDGVILNDETVAMLVKQALVEAEAGADMVMVKPGMPYLDVLRRIKDTFGMPTFAYQVSGEYAMIMAAAQNGWLDGDKAMMESLLAFKRAGACGVLSYFAPQVAVKLKCSA